MGNPEHIERIQNSTIEEWNKWRKEHLDIRPDLTRADLSYRDLKGIDFRGVGLFKVNFTCSDLRCANLRQSIAIEADFSGANLDGAFVYGISAWDITTDNSTSQLDLVITKPQDPVITLDSLQLAQFIHLLLNNKNWRDVIETLSTKSILILGRFADGHLAELQKLKRVLRTKNRIPILFDFEKPQNRNLTETIITLASMSKIVICDLTDSKSLPQELHATVPDFSSVTFQPIIKNGHTPYAMFEYFEKYPWVKPIIHYDNIEDIFEELKL